MEPRTRRRTPGPSSTRTRPRASATRRGTTGNPKGARLQPPLDAAARLRRRAARRRWAARRATPILPVVPMFHVNAWGLPYSARWSAPSWCSRARHLDGKSLYELIEAEKVTLQRPACPPCGRGLLSHLQAERPEVLHPQAHRDRRLGLPARHDRTPSRTTTAWRCMHAWGMTEMSPLGTLAHASRAKHRVPTAASAAASCRMKQGARGVRRRHEDRRRRRRGAAVGRQGLAATCVVRGPWVVEQLLPGRGRRPLVPMPTAAAGSRPATWPPSTPTASCRSPTAART